MNGPEVIGDTEALRRIIAMLPRPTLTSDEAYQQIDDLTARLERAWATARDLAVQLDNAELNRDRNARTARNAVRARDLDAAVNARQFVLARQDVAQSEAERDAADRLSIALTIERNTAHAELSAQAAQIEIARQHHADDQAHIRKLQRERDTARASARRLADESASNGQPRRGW